jgi:arrestin-related trafficking adapter 4/5/7
VPLSGALSLDIPDHMSIRSIKVRLEGRWKVSWSQNGPSTPHSSAQGMVKDRGTLVNEEQTIFPSNMQTGSTHRIAPGKHEWRFKFIMDPTLPESVEGLVGNCIVYNLTAEIDRGYMSKALMARKHVRIIRTLSRDMAEMIPFPYVSISLLSFAWI